MNNENIYKQYLEGEISLKNENLKPLYKQKSNEDCQVTIIPSAIVKMLSIYLNRQISEKELSEWASFIIVSDVYVSPNWEIDEQADKYESMWNILQQLSSPEIDGEVTPERVKEHIQVLQAIEKNL